MQVSFVYDGEDGVESSDSFSFKAVSGRLYHLYAHSYLDYGQDYAQQRLREALGSVQEDPCYPHGYSRQQPNGGHISGSGNAEQCQALIEKILMLPSSNAPGRYRGERSLHGPFIATENFYYTRADLNLPLGSQQISPAAMSSLAETECSRQFEGISGDPNHASFCFALSYQARVLSALNVPHDQMMIANKIHGHQIGWALGAALMLMSEHRGEPEQPPSLGKNYRYVLLLATMLACIFVCYVKGLCRRNRCIRWCDEVRSLFKAPTANAGLEDTCELVCRVSPSQVPLDKTHRHSVPTEVSALHLEHC